MSVPASKPLRPDQAEAADPFIHAGLSASAGSGKTQVLTARVLNLLLEGAAPESILCLTFTKAAAAEMAERVNTRLARWVRLDDYQLALELEAINVSPDPGRLARARRLFAAVLDCPGGLRIQTIHSFCQTLLAAFPAEAGITPGFRAIEGREEQALIERTMAALAEASDAGDGAFLADLQRLAGRLSEAGVRDYLRACASAVEGMALFTEPELVEPAVRHHILALPDEPIEALVARACADDAFDCAMLSAVSDAYREWGRSSGLEKVDAITAWLALGPEERCRGLEDLAQALLFTKNFAGRRSIDRGVLKLRPDTEAHCDALAEKVQALVDLLRADRLAPLLAAGIRAGARFAAAYAAIKRAAGVADFDDLIRWSRDLLNQPGISEWVRFKLDRRTDHLLVDEAQDTNASQWAIITALAEEYWAGQGAGPEHRTLFMVGDFKQAIYGFQGTDPAAFETARRDFRDMAAGGTLPWKDLSISNSFRSSQVVLDVVDKMLEILGPDALGLPEPPVPHVAFHANRPGRVELWAPYQKVPEAGEDCSEEGWEHEDKRHYARELADRIKALIDEAPVLAATGKPLTAGDILVLVRSRASGLAGLLVGRLFERGVPIAGLDRLELSEPFAVRDLLAAMQFAVQPLDDLNLANLLVSPLGGWSQDDLYELAGGHPRKRLWEELGRRRNETARFAETRRELEEVLASADYVGPYAFLEGLLSGPLGGRRKLLGRLGRAARDPINELLAAALTFERQESAGLQRFLHWFAGGKVEVKRDPEAQDDAVRIMTVHGAKGLEAPVVFLIDATADPAKSGGFSPPLDFPLPQGGALPLIRPRSAELCAPFRQLIEAERAADEREHFRLGYVALTRAAERLVVAGLKPRTKNGSVPERSWHAVVEKALRALDAVAHPDGSLVLERGAMAPIAPPVMPITEQVFVEVPEWARTEAPAEARPPRPLAPSQLGPDTESNPPPTPELRPAAERGRLLHALFERLPETPAGNRRAAALTWLERSGGVADLHARAALIDAALSVIEAPEHANLFTPGALAEAPIAATLPDGTVVAGAVDRLLVSDDTVQVVDFKTGRNIPADLSRVPASHRRQMQAYGKALSVIFPGKRIELALLYTEGPRLITLPLETVGDPTHMDANPNQELLSS